jgi:2-octaprenyl-6-methoxyphenol hydroxylase
MSGAATHLRTYDVAICGGGLVGASLALALAELSLRVALIEAQPFGSSEQQPSFDDRSTALSNGSRRIFEGIGVWPLLAREATAIRRIHVSDQGRFGFARIDAQEQGLPVLGFVLTNRMIGAALWQRLQQAQVEILAPATVKALTQGAGQRVLHCVRAAHEIKLAARLVVAADGAHSVVREAAGIRVDTRDYEQVALVSNVTAQRFHDHVAYERFTPDGPLALLPLSQGRMGLIWTLTPPAAGAVSKLDDAEFLMRLQRAFGFRLGRFTRVGRRQLYPLALSRCEQHVAERLALVGNAAQALHPIAGQGFNLGLRDAACLAELIADAGTVGADFDPGDGLLLERYRQWRAQDQPRIVRFTDGLVRLFMQPFAPLQWLRDAGLLAFDLLPPAKRAMAQLSLGAAANIPRLARGAPLRR